MIGTTVSHYRVLESIGAGGMGVVYLMLNGRFDFFLPEEGTQIPMFRLLGALDSQKRRVVYETGHNIPRPDLIRESLDWLDSHLGPVR